MAWLPHWDGLYIVQKGYYFAKFLPKLAYDIPKYSDIDPFIASFWEKLWACPAIPKILTRAWQATLDRLPTNENLFKRHMLNHHCSFICFAKTQSLKHVLYECVYAKEF